ncbi:TPR repeat-containing thioredoxin TTL1-like [Phalaenopsis equestris]|uniref:TPR repeat-containing thioredoxin TTL1-like n=1 Tax=Phalaenopsis equestris TaxID=78828 RepID=UPI0009E62333|nr:TPR repeat-containing thioredoxin TTL1-like [Phalaenopsis equestris]
MSLYGENGKAPAELDSMQERLRYALTLESNKPDCNDFHTHSTTLSPLRILPSASASSSSSECIANGIAGRRTRSGEHMVGVETSKAALGARSTKPGHRRSGSEPLIYAGFRGESSPVSSPATNVLPAGNICPSGKIGRSGIMSRSTAARSDVLGEGPRNYGHGSIVRGGSGGCVSATLGGEAATGSGLDPLTRRGMVSTDAEEVRRAGNELYRRGRFEEALRLYDRAIVIFPESAACKSNRAAALIGLGRLGEALKCCEEAVKLDPSFARAHHRLASLHIRFGQIESAGKHLFWPGLQPDNVELQKLQAVDIHMRRCAEARKIGDWKIALKESNAAIEAGADSFSLLLTAKAEATLRLHQLEEAESTISQALKLEISIPPPSQAKFFGLLSSSYTHMVNALVEMALGRFENSVASAEKARQIDPGNFETTMTLNKVRSVARARTRGNELFNAGKFEEACLAYGEGLKHDPSNPILYCNRATCMANLGLWENSVKDCSEALRIYPNHTKARLRRAASNGKLERWAESVKDYEVLRRELPGDGDVAEALLHAQVSLKALRGNDVSYLTYGGEVGVITGLEQFNNSVYSHGVSVVQFMAAIDQHCIQISPFIDIMSRRFPSVKFLKVDMNKNQAVFKAENVFTVPNFRIYKNGVMVKELIRPTQQLLEQSVRLYCL